MKCNTESGNEIVDAISKEYREIRQEIIKLIDKKLELENKLEYEKDTICYAHYFKLKKRVG